MLNRTADQAYIAQHKDDMIQFDDVANTHWAYYGILEASNSHKHRYDDSGEVWLEQ